MHSEAPDAVDLTQERQSVLDLYGIGQAETDPFGRKCLMARRLVERGVRFVQLYSGGGHNDDNWDAHGDLEFNHTRHAGRTDRPIAGLLKDLKQRGLLDETLVVWGGEFGRQPTAEYENQTGRDHNSWGVTMWTSGIKGGIRGKPMSWASAFAIAHVKNLQATILHLMGMDPNNLTYFHNGLDESLVGVEGAEPIRQVLA